MSLEKSPQSQPEKIQDKSRDKAEILQNSRSKRGDIGDTLTGILVGSDAHTPETPTQQTNVLKAESENGNEFRPQVLRIKKISPERQAKILKNVPALRGLVQQALKNLSRLEKNRPDVFEYIKKSYPKIYELYVATNNILKKMESAIDARGVNVLIAEYNSNVSLLNFALDNSAAKNAIDSIAQGRKIDTSKLAPEEQEYLKKFAKDLHDKLFPATYVERFVKSINEELLGSEQLMGSQRLALMVPNAMENIVTGFASLFKTDTWEQFYGGIEALVGVIKSPEDRKALAVTLKAYLKNMSTVDAITAAGSVIIPLITIWGGPAKIMKFFKMMNYPKKMRRTLQAIIFPSKAAKVGSFGTAIPLGILAGLRLNPIK